MFDIAMGKTMVPCCYHQLHNYNFHVSLPPVCLGEKRVHEIGFLKSSLFMMSCRIVWYYNMTVITLLSVIMLVATVMDYFVPVISNTLSPPEKWTAFKGNDLQVWVLLNFIVLLPHFLTIQRSNMKTCVHP